ncbi:MAG: cell envelope integrity protein TolA, partial [Desulfovibrionaceae bacterium]|nr:cell envelope integrity protein TolA [Desulfovibrionaceae bacterium]
EKPKPKEQAKEQPKDKARDKVQAKDQKNSRKEAKPKEKDAVQAALAQARRQASSRADSGDRGNSVERALAEARRQASGTRGGGGGEGAGPGGGGLHAVYLGQVMLAVRPNWGYASSTRQNLQCTILISVSTAGEVQECKVVRSSGNVQYDSSCVNAIMRTSRAGDFPPPPTPEYQNLEVVFTLNELRGA